MSTKKTPAATPVKPKAAKKATAAPEGADIAPAKGKSGTKPTPAAKPARASKPLDVAANAYGIKLGKGKKADNRR